MKIRIRNSYQSLEVKLKQTIQTFKCINQPDAAISQVYRLSFKYSSTCFGHPHAHHQELICSSSLWFTLERGGRAGGRDHDQQHCYHHVPTVNQRLLLQLIIS
jgi:hypothetical protein